MPLFGAHMSIAGGYQNALLAAQNLGGDTVQLFVSQPKTWPVQPLEEGKTNSGSGKVLTKNVSRWSARELADDLQRFLQGGGVLIAR